MCISGLENIETGVDDICYLVYLIFSREVQACWILAIIVKQDRSNFEWVMYE
jgi:hypothetical protein